MSWTSHLCFLALASLVAKESLDQVCPHIFSSLPDFCQSYVLFLCEGFPVSGLLKEKLRHTVRCNFMKLALIWMAINFRMQFKPIYNYQIFFKGSPRTINSNLCAPSEIHIMFQNMLSVRPLRLCLFIIMYYFICVLIHSAFIRGLCGIHVQTLVTQRWKNKYLASEIQF